MLTSPGLITRMGFELEEMCARLRLGRAKEEAMRWIGLDVHHLYIQLSELNEDDDSVSHAREPLNEDGLGALKQRLGQDADVVLEASTSSFAVHDALKPYARSIVVAHPAQTRGASALHVKTDLRDAETLARLLKSGFVRPVWVPPSACRALRSLMEFRWNVRTLHASMVNNMKACYRTALLPYPSDMWRMKPGRLPWAEPHVKVMVRSLLAVEKCLAKQLRDIDTALEKWSTVTAEAQLLQSIPGVGPVLAAAILSQIGDISRFPHVGRLSAYAGLVPNVYASGKTLRIGKLGHGGRHLLRWALWMATLHLVRRDRRFQAVYQTLSSRRPKKVALVACSRKLLVVIWHMLRRNRPFQHLRIDIARKPAERKTQQTA